MAMADDDVSKILNSASERAKLSSLPYQGAVTPEEAYSLVRSGAARIVDVRTRFEAEYVGRIPDTVQIEWRSMGAAEPNPAFLDELAKLGGPDENYLFLCRSGVRSHAAALAAAANGYSGAFNILEGFEGDLDSEKHRGSVGGWRFRGLPWIQG
jgi:rhodanese-related sulfurtransferase